MYSWGVYVRGIMYFWGELGIYRSIVYSRGFTKNWVGVFSRRGGVFLCLYWYTVLCLGLVRLFAFVGLEFVFWGIWVGWDVGGASMVGGRFSVVLYLRGFCLDVRSKMESFRIFACIFFVGLTFRRGVFWVSFFCCYFKVGRFLIRDLNVIGIWV